MREEPQRIAGRLEGTLRIPDGDPKGIVVVAHPLPTHGGTMRNPVVAAIARAFAERDWYALRFNFRGVGASAGEWSAGTAEWLDLNDAVMHARAIAPGLWLGVCGYSFGALMTLRWIEEGGRADTFGLVGMPLRSVSFERRELPRVPPGTPIVAGERDEFGSAAELREAYPEVEILEVRGADHFFIGYQRMAAALIADQLTDELDGPRLAGDGVRPPARA